MTEPRCRRRGHRPRPNCLGRKRDLGRQLPRRTVADPRDPARSRRAGPIRIGVRVIQRTHRTARQPRRGRAARHARHVSQLVLRSSVPCPTRKRATATRRPDKPSSTSPTARSSDCWSTTSRSTCATASCLNHERVLDLRAGTLDPLARWKSPAGKQVTCTSTRLVSLTQRSVAAIEYDGRSGRRIRPCHSAIGTGRQRGPARAVGRSPGRGHPRQTRWRPSSTRARNAVHC